MSDWHAIDRPSALAQVEGEIPDVHVISVRERRVSVDYPTIVQHNVNADLIELDLDGEWDGLSVVLLLGECPHATELAWTGEPITLPSSLAESTGGIDVSVVGYSADGETRLVTAEARNVLNVIKSGCLVGEVPDDDTPDLIGQLVAAGDAANQAASSANTAAEAASAAAEAARGNVLKGTLGPAKFLSADDAYATKPRELTVYGKTVQNLWVNPSGTNAGVTATANDDGSITIGGTGTANPSTVASKIHTLRPGGTYTLSVDKDTPDPGTTYFRVLFYDSDDGIVNPGITLNISRVATGTVPANAAYAICEVRTAEGTNVSGTYRVMLNEGPEAQSWCPPGLNGVDELSVVCAGKNLVDAGEFKEPPQVTTTPIDLDGHALNSLPDGTRDELTVDASGNVTLVQRVGSLTIPTDAGDVTWEGSPSNRVYFAAPNAVSVAASPVRLMCDVVPQRLRSEAEYVNSGSYVIISASKCYIRVEGTESAADTCSKVGGGTVLYPLATPQTIELPSVTLPVLPAPVCSVWADATSGGTGYAVGADVGVDYERDVNIAYEQLEAKIAELTVAQATD